MPEYVNSPLEDDDGSEDQLETAVHEFLRTRWPNWNPTEADLMKWASRALARMVADAKILAQDVPAIIFRYLGEKLFNVPFIDASAADTTATFSLSDNPAGRTIEEGFLIDIPDAGGDTVAFMVTQDSSASAGVLTIPNVPVTAVSEGAFTSGLGAPGQVVDPIDSREWVAAITLDAATANGADAETDLDYLNRLSARLTLMAPRPILARDFATMAIDIAAQNGVKARAVGVDNYNPVTNTYNNEKTVYVVMADADTGLNVPGSIKTAVSDELEEQRELNFVVFTGDPTVNTIDVTYVGKAVPESVPADVEVAVDSALQDYLSRANWGQPNDYLDTQGWRNTTVVRYLEVAAVINAVNGFNYLTSLTIGLNGGAQGTADINLAGAVPVTTPGVINSTVTA